jgi:thymidine phosphorylase
MTNSPIVRDLVRCGDEPAMRRLINAADADALSDDDLAELASTLASSGARLAPSERCADVASTGGPSSLSTLLCPLQLRCRGLLVPKLGVPGRPAGGIDVLQTVPGYRAALAPETAERALQVSGYVHLLADDRWAPLDARLFAYRNREGGQAVPALVIASILAKKLAAGVVGAGLEIRIAPHGNFGADLAAARTNARRYNAVARLLALKPLCALTDATRPYQPYIGRGESLLALADILEGRAGGWLADHLHLCQRISDAVAAMLGVEVTGPIDRASLWRAHDALLLAHGAEPSAFLARVEEVRTARRSSIRADRTGVVSYDLGRLRQLLVARQRAGSPNDENGHGDPAGVILGRPAGEQLEIGESMMSIRVPHGEDVLAAELAACCRIDRAGEARASSGGTFFEII